MRKLKVGNVTSHICLVTPTPISIFPLAWTIISSLKGRGELTGSPTVFWPETWTFDYYAHVTNDLKFFVNIRNSVIISLVTTLIATTAVVLVAYGIVRFFKRLESTMSKVLVTTHTFPPIPPTIPYSMIMGKLGLTNTRIDLAIVYPFPSVPYAVRLLTRFFRVVFPEIKEAARIDGVNKMQTFAQVVLPLVAPGVVTMATYIFINARNEFPYALISMNNTNKMTVVAALRSLDEAEISDRRDMMVASALVVLPSVIFFYLMQNKIAGGMSEGAVKS